MQIIHCKTKRKHVILWEITLWEKPELKCLENCEIQECKYNWKNGNRKVCFP